MEALIGIVVAIIGLGFLILVHELGHFLVAKLTGIRVEEFSIGFGRYLVSRRVGETVYGISILPLGGYVRVTGMHKEDFEACVAEAREERARRLSPSDRWDDSDEDHAQQPEADGKRRPRDPEDRLAGARAISAEEIAATPLERRYYSHPFWHKFLFIVAGVAMNVVAAFVLLWVVGFTQGQNVISTVLAEVEPGSPAAASGMQAGDRIVGVGGRSTTDWADVRLEILTRPGEPLVFAVERGAGTLELTVVPAARDDGTGFIGVMPTAEHRELGALSAVGHAAGMTADMTSLVFRGIGMMFTGQVPVTGDQGLAGPIGIIQLSSEAVAGGYYLGLLALISINLAILNMIPLLPLDGGHVLFGIIERVRGRSFSLRTFERISMVGLALFAVLFIVATSNDVGRLFGS